MFWTPAPLQGSLVFYLGVLCQPVGLLSMGPHGSLVSCYDQTSHRVSLRPCARAHLERFAAAIFVAGEKGISPAIAKTGRSRLRDGLLSAENEFGLSSERWTEGWIGPFLGELGAQWAGSPASSLVPGLGLGFPRR